LIGRARLTTRQHRSRPPLVDQCSGAASLMLPESI
jgi:hypothetical protein